MIPRLPARKIAFHCIHQQGKNQRKSEIREYAD
jgi:hypothetical protein